MHILALRSYGDYVILLNSIKNADIKQDVQIIASNHLKPIHEALNVNFSTNFNFIFKDLGIKNGLLGFFTNKHFFSFNTIYEILKLSKSLKSLKIKVIYKSFFQKKISNLLLMVLNITELLIYLII